MSSPREDQERGCTPVSFTENRESFLFASATLCFPIILSDEYQETEG